MFEIRSDARFRIDGSTVEVYIPGNGLLGFHHLCAKELSFFQQAVSGVDLALCRDPALERLFSNLVALRVLKPKQSPEASGQVTSRTLDWLWYKVADPSAFMARLAGIKIGILGCGGLGSVILHQLLQTGFRTFLLVDSGNVDRPDLNRQLIYSKDDLGLRKIDACRNYIQEEYGDAVLTCTPDHVDSTVAFQAIFESYRPHLVFATLDKPALVDQFVVEASIGTDTPVILGGVGISDAVVGPLLLDASAKTDYLAAESLFPANSNVTGSNAMTNAIAATYMAYEAMKYFMGEESEIRNGRRVIHF